MPALLPRWGRLGVVLLVLVALGGCRDDRSPATGTGSTTAPGALGSSTSSRAAAVQYGLEPTKRCLEGRGAAASEVRPTDERLQALRDLAQRNSFQVTVGAEVVGMAFAASGSDAQLLAELLTVPEDRYRIVTKENVVLIFRSPAEATFRASVECLRP